jgi:hypothetical protein
MSRRLLLLLCVPALAACGDSTGPGDNLTTQDVAGIYSLCALSFVPEGGVLPAVDIRAKAFETTNTQVLQPRVTVDVNPATFELKYTPIGQFSDRELDGSYTIRGNTVTLKFGTGSDVAPGTLLLPGTIPVDFQKSPQALSTDGTAVYNVAKADYARLAGISESGLAAQIPGRTTARFSTGSCSATP